MCRRPHCCSVLDQVPEAQLLVCCPVVDLRPLTSPEINKVSSYCRQVDLRLGGVTSRLSFLSFPLLLFVILVDSDTDALAHIIASSVAMAKDNFRGEPWPCDSKSDCRS